MKQKTKKTIAKRYTLTNPKRGKGKVRHDSPGFSKKILKKRAFRVFRGKDEKSLGNKQQSQKVIKQLS